MKRIKVITAIITMITMFIVMPFSVAKAETVSTDYLEISEGSITTSLILGSSSTDYLSIDLYGITSDDKFLSASVVDVQLDGYYTGSITLTFAGTLSYYTSIYVFGDGVYTHDIGNDTDEYIVNITSCQNFQILFLSTRYNTAYGQVYSASTSLTQDSATMADISSDLAEMADYQIDKESIGAYLFGTNSFKTSVQYTDAYIYPYFAATAGDYGRSCVFVAGETVYYYFYSSNNSTTISMLNDNVTYTLETVDPYTFSGFRLFKATFTNSNDSNKADRIVYGVTANIIPIYFGNGKNMSQEMQSLTQHQSETYTTSLLQQLIDAITGDGDSTTSDNIDAANDDITTIVDQETQISDDVASDFNDFSDGVDLTTFNFTDGISNATQYFKMVLTDVFEESAPIRAMWVVPVICIVLMALLGG